MKIHKKTTTIALKAYRNMLKNLQKYIEKPAKIY